MVRTRSGTLGTALRSWKQQVRHPGGRGGTCSYTEQPLGVRTPFGLRSVPAGPVAGHLVLGGCSEILEHTLRSWFAPSHRFTDGKLQLRGQALVDIWERVGEHERPPLLGATLGTGKMAERDPAHTLLQTQAVSGFEPLCLLLPLRP